MRWGNSILVPPIRSRPMLATNLALCKSSAIHLTPSLIRLQFDGLQLQLGIAVKVHQLRKGGLPQ